MDFYQRKQKAKKDIQKLYDKGTSTNQIIYVIGLNYGFGKKVVLEQIELIEQLYQENTKKTAKIH